MIGKYLRPKKIFFLLVPIPFFCLFYFLFRPASSSIIGTDNYQSTGSVIEEQKPAKKVCLDPGHGGNDIGAAYGDINESEINLEVATMVKEELVRKNYSVVMTRSDDSFIYKKERSEYCNTENADIMVSIHHNSYASDHSVDYATSLYYKDGDALLASSVLQSIADSLRIRNEGISKFNNSLLWIAEMPATLTEGFFITNTSEYRSLTTEDSDRIAKEAEGISDGIINYFENPDKIALQISDDPLIIDRID